MAAGRGYAGANLMADFEIDYEYAGHEFDSFDDFTNLLSANLYFAQDTRNVATDVEHIMKQAVEYARSFLRNNGNVQTGRLLDSITAEPVGSGGDHWRLVAPARDARGHLYAGHIEYGFTDKMGQARGPWPFLRPAMRIAAHESTGDLAEKMKLLVLYGADDRLNIFKYGSGRLALGRTGASHSNYKANQIYHKMSNAYRGNDSNPNKSWGRAYNGYNGRDLSGNSVRNDYSISSWSYDWEAGHL